MVPRAGEQRCSVKNHVDFYVYGHGIHNLWVNQKNIGNFTGFEWYQGNLTQNWDQHDVSSGECEQIFFDRPLIIKRDKEHSKIENRYYVLGRSNVNLLFFAVFTVRNDKIRIISARDMTDAKIERYLK